MQLQACRLQLEFHLQPIDCYRTRTAYFARLTGQAWTSRFGAIGAVNHAAFGFTPRPRPTGFARVTARPAVNPNADPVIRVVAGQFETHVGTRSTCLPITAIVSVMTFARRTPSATRLRAIATIKPRITGRALAATRINNQLGRL